MELDNLKMIVEGCIRQLYEKDLYLIETDVHEQTISSTLACYLRAEFERQGYDWSIDLEYNRNGEVPKRLIDRGCVKPDIIIHRRGKTNERINSEVLPDNNLLIIEIKKNPNVEEKQNDIDKIEAFINEDPFKYCFGVFIELKDSETECIYV